MTKQEELVKKRNEHREAINKINSQLGTLRFEENKKLVGKYYQHKDTDAIVYMSITGVDTGDNLKCHMIVNNLADNSYSLTRDGVIAKEYVHKEISREDFNCVKSSVVGYINTML